jgi:hypothetical protein
LLPESVDLVAECAGLWIQWLRELAVEAPGMPLLGPIAPRVRRHPVGQETCNTSLGKMVSQILSFDLAAQMNCVA